MSSAHYVSLVPSTGSTRAREPSDQAHRNRCRKLIALADQGRQRTIVGTLPPIRSSAALPLEGGSWAVGVCRPSRVRLWRAPSPAAHSSMAASRIATGTKQFHDFKPPWALRRSPQTLPIAGNSERVCIGHGGGNTVGMGGLRRAVWGRTRPSSMRCEGYTYTALFFTKVRGKGWCLRWLP